MCRTGNITLRCQYGGVENVLSVVWVIGNETTTNPSTIPGHTALPCTTTYQKVVVDSYTNLRDKYRCDVALSNGTGLPSNEYDPISECEHAVKLQSIHTALCMKWYLCPRFTQDYNLCFYSCWSYPFLLDLGKQDSHHFECHLVSRLPQVLLLHCVPLHPRWLHHCHPTCRQWHLPHSDLPPTRHQIQDWGGGCEERRQSRQTEGKGRGEFLLLSVCERMFVTEHVRSCQSGNLLSLCTNSHAPNFRHNWCCSLWNYLLNTYKHCSSTEAYCLFRDSGWANPMHLHTSSFSCHLHHVL